jgi:selenide,water dikinase
VPSATSTSTGASYFPGEERLSNTELHDPRAAVRLTSFSHGAGCACKLGPAELAQVLGHLPPVTDPRVLVDAGTRDDAAVVRLGPDRALVATTDFFTPIVDDAGSWGAIAAANALSDLYAMGATPTVALSLVGWPRVALPFDLLGEVLRGAAEIAAEAACPIVGGHSIDAPEPFFGLAALGEAHPDRLLTLGGARPGDALLLTKPLGTGILTTAHKRGTIAADGPELAAAIASMRALNAAASRAALAHGVRAATDVTGFGLLGHLNNLLRGSGVAAEVEAAALPRLPGAAELAAAGMIPGGSKRNREAAQAFTEWSDSVDEATRWITADAQTSGGLLLAVPAAALDAIVAELGAAVIGRVTSGAAGRIHVR